MTALPLLAHTREELTSLLASRSKSQGRQGRVGFVPTMGALHEGHASLMRRARVEVGEDPVVVSIFVNPTQFAPGEDFERYPRTLDADLAVCGDAGVDLVFVPEVSEVYPRGLTADSGHEAITVDPGPLATVLEGKSRPTHFRGVLTVVAKLFGLVRPDVAVFGQKDYQQLALINRMVEDLCLGIDIVGAETIRETDGLAMSSRNRYLDADQRREAVALSRSLYAAQSAAAAGPAAALEAAHAQLRKTPGVELDYLEIRLLDLSPLPSTLTGESDARILIAARVGATRLIDNLPITLGNDGATQPQTTDLTQGDS